jgi:ribosomal protein S11
MLNAAGVKMAHKGECSAPTERPHKQPMEKKQMMEKKSMMEKKQMMEKTMAHKSKIKSGTMISVQDPGLGHESHQLAVILPPSDMIYKGTLTYAASEPIQLVVLTGPLAKGEDNGQPIWTPDGKTKFALTIVDPQTSSGTWNFAGNALAVHTKNTTPFTVSYTVSYAEKEKSTTVSTGTITSVQDPGLGHESHQLAVILPPSDMPYSGILTYSASEPVQLVALHGPLAKGEDNGQPIWTPDGKTKFALTIVDPQTSSGTWNFAGNALAVHTKNTTPFTVSYTVVASQ